MTTFFCHKVCNVILSSPTLLPSPDQIMSQQAAGGFITFIPPPYAQVSGVTGKGDRAEELELCAEPLNTRG